MFGRTKVLILGVFNAIDHLNFEAQVLVAGLLILIWCGGGATRKFIQIARKFLRLKPEIPKVVQKYIKFPMYLILNGTYDDSFKAAICFWKIL